MVVVDTNVLLDNPEILLNDTEQFAISYVTLSELDGLKSNPDLNYPARTAIKIIHSLFKEDKILILNVPEENKTNDEKIVQDCKAINGTLMSQDIGALVVAEARGVKTFEMNSLSKEYDKEFKGYEEYYVDSKFYYRLTQNEYQIDEIEIPLEEHIKDKIIPMNSYIVFYPFGESSNNYMVWKKTKDKYILIPQGTKHLRSAGIGLDWLHPEQLIAFDCIFNDDSPLAVITGKIGASKTLMSLCGALARTVGHKNKKLYDKILVTRPNIPINKQYALGFMKGSLEEKMEGWLAPFKTNLQFLFETTQKDIENEEASKIYESYFKAMPIESIQGASFHNKILLVDECYSADTEVLTEKGWQRFDSLEKGIKVLQYNTDTKSTEFVYPTRYIEKDFSGDMVNLKSDNGFDFLVTPKHEMLVYQKGVFKKQESDLLKINPNKYFMVAGDTHINNSEDNILTPLERLAIATQADGSVKIKKSGDVSLQFSFAKIRKIERLLKICEDGNFRITENKKQSKKNNISERRRFWISLDTTLYKNLWNTFTLTNLNRNKAIEIIEEMVEWDGHKNRNSGMSYLYTTTEQNQCDFYQAVAHIAGYKTKITKVVDNRKTTYKDVFRLFITKNMNKISTQCLSKSYVPYKDKVYCVTVPSGNILVRRNLKVAIAGNCQLLDTNTLRQIMSRVATGSKLVLILDPSQTYGANRGNEGYKKLLPHCKGNEYISFINLQHIQRSELTKLVDEIFA